MATITMDTSEYEALKKNIQILEEFKNREKQLNLEIQRLNEEKIQTLKDAEKSVTIIKKNIKEEYIRVVRSPDEIMAMIRMLNYNTHFDSADVINAFFEKSIHTSFPIEETVILKGLEEFKEEFRKEYTESLSAETQKQLDSIPGLRKEISQNIIVKGENYRLKKDLEDSIETIESFKVSRDYIQRNFSDLKYKVRNLSNRKWTVFNFSEIKKELKSYLND